MERKIGEKFEDPEFGWCVVKKQKCGCVGCVGAKASCHGLLSRNGTCAGFIFAKTTPPNPAAKKPAKPAPSCTCPHCGGALKVVAA